MNISGFAQGGGFPIYDKNLSILQAGTEPKTAAQPSIGTTNKAWPSESGKSFVNGKGKSPSTQGGSWQPENKTLSDDILKIQADLMIKERDFGLGGSEIIEISKNKLENIGTVMNDYGSIRFDPIGKLVNNEVLVGSSATYTNSDSGPLLEYVDVQDLPGGTYNLNVNNRYNVMVGAGGINLKSYGPTNISGSITNVAGQQVNIGSENEINLDAKVINISAEILKLRNKRQRQALGQTVAGVVIGYVTGLVDEGTLPVYGGGGSVGAPSVPDSITTYPHTHTFNNIPLTLTDTNESTRNSAKNQGINSEKRVIASPQFNTLKSGITIDAAYVESLSGVGGVGTERE